MKYSILLFTTLFSGCCKNPIATLHTNNPSIDVEFLFEKDGCKVYRFDGGSNYHYFTNCTGETMADYQSGKIQVHENIPTVRRK